MSYACCCSLCLSIIFFYLPSIFEVFFMNFNFVFGFLEHVIFCELFLFLFDFFKCNLKRESKLLSVITTCLSFFYFINLDGQYVNLCHFYIYGNTIFFCCCFFLNETCVFANMTRLLIKQYLINFKLIFNCKFNFP